MNPIIANQVNSVIELLALKAYLDQKELTFEEYMDRYQKADQEEKNEIAHEYEIFKEEMRKYIIENALVEEQK